MRVECNVPRDYPANTHRRSSIPLPATPVRDGTFTDLSNASDEGDTGFGRRRTSDTEELQRDRYDRHDRYERRERGSRTARAKPPFAFLAPPVYPDHM